MTGGLWCIWQSCPPKHNKERAAAVCQDEVRNGTLAVLPVENLSMMHEINIAYYGEFGQPDVPHDIMKIYNETARL